MFGLFIEPFYDDWCDWRDGRRDQFCDFKLIKKIHRGQDIDDGWIKERIRMNKKQKRLLRRRKRRKYVRPRN